MPASFEWEFEEDERPSRRRELRPAPSARRRHWLRRAGLLLLLLVLAGLAARVWLAQRQRAIAEIEARLRAIVELELRTIAEGDAELFRHLQDPGDPTWRDRQVARFLTRDGLQFPPAPGLEPADRPTQIRRVRLLGRTARVGLTRWFRFPGADNASPAVDATPLPFHLTWFYRQDREGSWHHAAPPQGEWRDPYFTSVDLRIGDSASRQLMATGLTVASDGRTLGVSGDRFVVRERAQTSAAVLHIRATQAEAGLLAPIADELGDLIARGCSWLACASDARYNLSFEDVPGPLVTRGRWTLPYLYLAGLPANEAARAAWERALQLWLVEALARSEAYRGLLTRRLIYVQMVQRLQAALDLRAPVGPDVTLLAPVVAAGRQHSLMELWVARPDMSDPAGTRLIEAEVVALLDFLEAQAGARATLWLIPLLHARYQPVEVALPAVLGREWEAIRSAWFAYLSELTGEAVVPFSTLPRLQVAEQHIADPRPLVPPAAPAGDQLALVCDGQVWVGSADGRYLVPLTPAGQRFRSPIWSPDGRWLLTHWRRDAPEPRSALYRLAADGSAGQILADAPALEFIYYGLSPDGRFAVYGRRAQLRAVDSESGQTRLLPGLPIWSPDGARLLYVSRADGGVWLADADWGNPRRIDAGSGLLWDQALWSPDGAQVALTVDTGQVHENAAGVYDLGAGRLTTILTFHDLLAAAEAAAEGPDLNGFDQQWLRLLWPVGWSSDGRRLLVRGELAGGPPEVEDATLLVALPVADSGGRTSERLEPRVVAIDRASLLDDASWSPTDPQRLVFRWQAQGGEITVHESVLFDLQSGALYTATGAGRAAWSPDGNWVAFLDEEALTLVDREGQAGVTWSTPGGCTDLAWNPAADLSGLGAPPVADD